MKVELLDYMGDDLAPANDARVSFNKHKDKFDEKDERLISFLSSHDHWTPFAHSIIKVRETVPIFVARQRFKHTVGFVYNEVSRRYVDEKPEFFYPDGWRERAANKKQGSADTIHLKDNTFNFEYESFLAYAVSFYENLIDEGVAPEQARMVLPQSMYTSYVCTGSLYAFARAYRLRSKEDAQREIQDLAAEWDRIIRPLFPVAWRALVDH